jgi:hypothetical protein
VIGTSECGNALSGPTKYGEILDYLKRSYLQKKDPVLCSE